MNQTKTREMLACLEVALMERVSCGQAVKWMKSFGSAKMLLESAVENEQWLNSLKADVRKNLEEIGLLWRQGRMTKMTMSVLQKCKEKNIGWVTLEEERYPQYLKEINDPPVVLFYKGDLNLAKGLCISVVGSRRATAYGQKAAYEIAAEAAGAGITVVSGMAIGVDACAHKGAMDAAGYTIAVMPCGLDLCYPKSNEWLYNRVCQSGLALSEYPPGKKAEKWHFVERNRVVSGLSVATVVAQAGPKSGSIRTAQLAAEQGREVFGVPGDIFDLEYLGVHNLIQDGANVLTSPKGLIRALSGQVRISMHSEKKLGHAVNYELKRSSTEISGINEVKLRRTQAEKLKKEAGEFLWLYEKVDEFGCLPEKLCEMTGRGAQQVQQAITMLEMQGLIKRDKQQRVVKI